MADRDHLENAFSIPKGFKIHEVRPRTREILEGVTPLALPAAPPPLGPLAAFVGNWNGMGFNTIFRPQHQTFPLPTPAPGDNLLELNLTSETLSFNDSLGSIPNRGMLQDDLFMNGVPYVQSINDVTNPAPPTGIHFEPGIWLSVPATTDPQEPISVARMASIPHGTTIIAQGVILPTTNGPPNIHPVDITPFPIGGGAPIRFPSQTAATQGTARIPQDLTPWLNAGTITQGLLDDPNQMLKKAISVQKILSTTTMIVSTKSEIAAVRRRNEQYRLSARQRRGQPCERQRHPDGCDLLDRNRRAPASHRLSEWKRADDRPAAWRAIRTSRPDVSPRRAHSADRPEDHQGDLDADPVQPEGHSQLQRLVMAACLGRDAGSVGSASDPGLCLAMMGAKKPSGLSQARFACL